MGNINMTSQQNGTLKALKAASKERLTGRVLRQARECEPVRV